MRYGDRRLAHIAKLCGSNLPRPEDNDADKTDKKEQVANQ